MGIIGQKYVERHSLSASLIDGAIAFETVEDEEVETGESQMGK